MQTNGFSAEFGRSAGAVVNVSIKSGTNATHGSGFYYNRDSALAATSWNAHTSLRPNSTGIDPNRNSDAKANRTGFLDAAAYTVPALNTPGNALPAGAWGPGAWTTDLSLVKRFTFDVLTADVRAEAFNLFNHTNYAQPNGSYPTSSFGSITSAGDPCIVQLAVRVGS